MAAGAICLCDRLLTADIDKVPSLHRSSVTVDQR